MTVVKLKAEPSHRLFNNFMDTFFQNNQSMYTNGLEVNSLKSTAPVNIDEKEDHYQLQVVAPGLQKEDFSINLDKSLLSISAEVKNNTEQETGKLVRKEYKFQSFKRSFTIDEKIDAEKISAEYVNGVLLLNLPKKAEVKPATKQISVQ